MIMDLMSDTPVKHRTFTFRTSTVWSGGSSATLDAEGKPTLHVSSPPEFKGEKGSWTSEDMFVAAVETCHMATFLAYAAKHNIPIISYRSHANGVLEYVDGDYRFTRIVIFPTITVESAEVEKEVHSLLREAQKHCLVANSIASIIEVNPTIMVR
jgi:organic hydroperoxide reductase OsmC/OhrA